MVNFLAIALYTRLLSPDEYGLYALVIAGVGLVNVIFFQWLSHALFRFLPVHLNDPRQLLSTILAGFCALALMTGGVGLLLAWIWRDSPWQGLILLSVPLLWALAWFELSLSLSAIKLQPLRYGFINGFKAVSALSVGILLIMWGLKMYGPLLGLLIGMLLSSVMWGISEWKGVLPGISRPLLAEILRYGLPLSATFALAFVVSSSDRFLIAWVLGEGPAGVYSAAYDLGQQSLILLMGVVNLASYPIVVRALEQKGVDSAREHLRQNAILLMAVSVPAAVGMAVLAPNVSAVLLGAGFREDAAFLLPWVALAILLAGLRSYHFDLAFQLGKHTIGQVWVVGAAALLNILLNIWWIKSYGLMGAAYATFAAYFLALLLSAAMGRRRFSVPIPYSDGFKIILASLIMALPLWLSLEYQGFYALSAQVLSGCAVYSALLALLNVDGYRSRILRRLMG